MGTRRRWTGLLLVLALIAVFALAACGGDDEKKATPTAAATATTAATTEPTAEATAEATTEATVEATAEATQETAAEATVEPTAEATTEAAVEPTSGATEVAMAQPTVQATEAGAAEEPTAQATEAGAAEAAVTETPLAVAEGEAAVEEIIAPALIDCEAHDLSALKIGLVTDVGQINDKSFNQSSWEGVLAAERCGATADYIETVDAADYADNIAEFAENNYDVIVTVGFALGTATLEAAATYPDVHFIGVDQFQGEAVANVTGLVFHEDQSGYLAGVLAARLTQTGTIAAVLGTDQVPPVVAFKEGYEAGARAVNPDITIISTYHPGAIDQAFTDPEWGASTAQQALDQNADVVFGAGGKTGNGALIQVANAVGADGPPPFCIGVDSDQWLTVPEAHPCLVSSAMKLLDVGVSDLIVAISDETIEGGNSFGQSALAPFHDLADKVPQDVQDELTQAAAGLASGEIVTGYGAAAPAEEPTTEGEATVAPEGEAAATETPQAAAAVTGGGDLGTVKVGLNAEYQPFEFVDENGEITGFDPDLVKAIAERAGFDVEFVNTRWDGIFVALQSGEFDMVSSAATITPEREEIVDFSKPYFNAGQMIAVREADADKIKTADDLAGLRVAVQAGTTGDILASALPGVEVVRYDEITLAFQALASKDVDAVLNDAPVSADIIKSNPDLGAVLVGDPLSDEFYGIAVNPDKPELLDAVNKALDELIADGTYAEIYMKWFDTEPPTMFQPGAEGAAEQAATEAAPTEAPAEPTAEPTTTG